jgi:hypothetical protein
MYWFLTLKFSEKVHGKQRLVSSTAMIHATQSCAVLATSPCSAVCVSTSTSAKVSVLSRPMPTNVLILKPGVIGGDLEVVDLLFTDLPQVLKVFEIGVDKSVEGRGRDHIVSRQKDVKIGTKSEETSYKGGAILCRC